MNQRAAFQHFGGRSVLRGVMVLIENIENQILLNIQRWSAPTEREGIAPVGKGTQQLHNPFWGPVPLSKGVMSARTEKMLG